MWSKSEKTEIFKHKTLYSETRWTAVNKTSELTLARKQNLALNCSHFSTSFKQSLLIPVILVASQQVGKPFNPTCHVKAILFLTLRYCACLFMLKFSRNQISTSWCTISCCTWWNLSSCPYSRAHGLPAHPTLTSGKIALLIYYQTWGWELQIIYCG